MDGGRIEVNEHRSRPWRVHGLLDDFTIEDVWRLPVTLRAEQSLAGFRAQAMRGLISAEGAPLVRLLFYVRLALGRLLRWDPPVDHAGVRPGSIRERKQTYQCEHYLGLQKIQ